MIPECHQINGLAQACSYSRGLEIDESHKYERSYRRVANYRETITDC